MCAGAKAWDSRDGQFPSEADSALRQCWIQGASLALQPLQPEPVALHSALADLIQCVERYTLGKLPLAGFVLG